MKTENPFKISYAKNDVMGGYDLMVQIGGIKDEAQAKAFAAIVAEWLTEKGAHGWSALVQ